jgi:hypothetical protein
MGAFGECSCGRHTDASKCAGFLSLIDADTSVDLFMGPRIPIYIVLDVIGVAKFGNPLTCSFEEDTKKRQQKY